MYWRTTAIGSFMFISVLPFVALSDCDHCIWSSMFEKAALSLSAFLISSALT